MSAHERLRIGLITPGFSASDDDWCIPALRDLAIALRRRVELTVFALRYPHTDVRYRVFDVPVQPFGGAGARGARRVRLLGGAVAAVRAQLRSGQLDAVHALWAHEPGLVATLACAGSGKQAVVSLLGGELARLPQIDYGGQLSRFNRWATTLSLRRAAAVTVGSEYLRSIGAASGFAAQHWHHLPLGVDTQRLCPVGELGAAPLIDGDPCLLHVGSLTPVKGQGLLLESFAALAPRLPSARLHLVGEGPLRQRLVAEAEHRGVAHSVSFHGHVEHEHMPALYRQADLLLVTSWFESQSVAALEAAACGCAAFGTAVGLLPEIDGTALCEDYSPASYSNGLLELLANRSQLASRGARARAWALRHGNVEDTAERFVSLYRQRIQAAEYQAGRRSEISGATRK